MSAALAIAVMLLILVAGFRYPGAWLAGVFLTYETGALAHLSWLGTAYVIVAVALSLVRFYTRSRPVYLHRSDVLTLALAMLLTVSAVWSKDVPVSEVMLPQLWMSLLGTFMLARFATGDPRKITRELVVTLAVASAMLAPAMLSSRAIGDWAASNRLLIENSDASAVGLTMAFPFALLASSLMIFTSTRALARLVGMVCLLTISYLAVISATRGVFLSAGLAFLVAFALLQTRGTIIRNLTFGLTAAGALFFFFADVSSSNLHGPMARLTAVFGGIQGDQSSLARVGLFRTSFRIIGENPLFGVGYGGFAHYGSKPYPHNMFLEMAVSAGAAGLLLSLFWLLFHAFNLRYIFKRERQAGVMLIAFSLAAVLQLQVSFPFSAAKPLFLLIAFAAAMKDCVLIAVRRNRRPRRGFSVPGVPPQPALGFPS